MLETITEANKIRSQNFPDLLSGHETVSNNLLLANQSLDVLDLSIISHDRHQQTELTHFFFYYTTAGIQYSEHLSNSSSCWLKMNSFICEDCVICSKKFRPLYPMWRMSCHSHIITCISARFESSWLRHNDKITSDGTDGENKTTVRFWLENLQLMDALPRLMLTTLWARDTWSSFYRCLFRVKSKWMENFFTEKVFKLETFPVSVLHNVMTL